MPKNNLLRKNIDRYMDLKGFRFYTDLLYAIGLRLGLNDKELESFPDKEKNNFSKMLKGERPLKYEFIIPLEEIFGVSLAKLLNDDSYYQSINKEDIPFLKGFRYYAYKDEYNLYGELFKSSTIDGEMIICNTDEYNKNLFDYLIEYRSFNGIRYLVEKYDFKFDASFNQYRTSNVSMVFSTLPVQLAKLIIDSNDDKLFNRIYDTFDFLIKYYKDCECLFRKEEFIEALLNNDNIYKTIFSKKSYEFNDINEGVIPNDGLMPSVAFINPMINIVLDYALSNLDNYKTQAIEILKYGIDYNKEFINNLQSPINEYHCSETGIVHDRYGRRYYGNVIITNKVTINEKVNELINRLPKI